MSHCVCVCVCVCVHTCTLSRVLLFVTPWTVASQAPLSVGFSRQEYWSGLPFPIPGDLPDPGIKPASFSSPSPPRLAGGFPSMIPPERPVMSCYVFVAQSSPTLCSPVDYSLTGSSVHGILQARILERIFNSSSRGSSRPRDRTQVFCIAGRFFAIWATREAQSLIRRV